VIPRIVLAVLHRLSLGEYFGQPVRRFRAHGLLLTENRFEPKKLIARHEHAYPHLTVVLKGGFDETYDEATLACRRGMVLVVPARCPHVDSVTADGAHSLSIELSRGRANRIGRESSLLSEPRILSSHSVFAAALTVYAEFRRGSAGSPLAMEHAVLGLLVAAIDETTVKPVEVNPPWLDRVLDGLRSGGAAPRLTQLARIAGLHPTHLSRAFRQHMGCTLTEFSFGERLNRAASLIRESELSIAEVAADCGFSDHAHLTRAFRKRFGMPPSHYREAR